MISGTCPECAGTRLNARSAAVRVALTGAGIAVDDTMLTSLGIDRFFKLDVDSAHGVTSALAEAFGGDPALKEIVTGIEQRLRFLRETWLGYLTLDRDYATLSGGEAQRVRLATQLGMGLMGVIYVLDEPSIGLHPHDNQKLLETLR